MQFTTVYLIEPRAALRDRAASWDDKDFAQYLLEPRAFTRKEGGRTAWTNADHEECVKLLHVANTRALIPLLNEQDAITYLGSDEVSAEVFDQWWTLKRFDCEESEDSESVLRDFKGKVRVGRKGIDSWVTWLKGQLPSGR